MEYRSLLKSRTTTLFNLSSLICSTFAQSIIENLNLNIEILIFIQCRTLNTFLFAFPYLLNTVTNFITNFSRRKSFNEVVIFFLPQLYLTQIFIFNAIRHNSINFFVKSPLGGFLKMTDDVT